MPSSKRTILIVDDDRSILRVFTRVLERKGYIVTAVATGVDALGQIACNHFDAALLDVRLPDMEGTALLPTLQKTSPETVRIVFTGTPERVCLANGKCNNTDAFLLKPVAPEVLLQVLDEKIAEKLKN